MGKVGFGELAFWLVAHAPADAVGDAGVRGGAGRAGRPRLHPDRDRRPAHLPVGAGLAAGRAGRRAARRRLAVPRRDRGLRHATCTMSSSGVDGHLPTDDAGWDALALEAVTATRAARRFVPGLGHPVHKAARPADAGADRHRRGGGPARPAPAAVRGDRPGARAGARAGGCRSTAPGVCGAALADLGLPVELLRGFALLARAAGLLGQLAEERRRPIGMDAYLAVDRNAVYVDPPRTEGTRDARRRPDRRRGAARPTASTPTRTPPPGARSSG